MAIISKNTALIVGTIVIVGAGAGAIGYVVGSENAKDIKPKDVTKLDEDVSALEKATKPPENTQTPTAIAKDISKYIDKQVTVYGIVTQVDANTYLVVGQEAKDPGGLPLDFSKNKIDPAKYANTPPASNDSIPTLKGPVVITGTMKRTDKSIVLVVDTIQEKN